MSSIVEMRNICKTFPGVIANDGVDFILEKGEIQSLLGENGAGKTTLMNILYGLYNPDSGEILINGEKVKFANSRDAIAHGLGMVHQHFMLVQKFTVAENIILGQKSPQEPKIENLGDVNKRLLELSEKYGLAINPESLVWTLSVGEQQRVEILKALYRGAEILILDEPTAVLTPQEVDEFLQILKRLSNEGKSIVFISHKLTEVLAISDRITVLRDGKVIDTVNSKDAKECTLAQMMVGREVNFTLTKKPCKPKEIRLQIEKICANNDRGLEALHDVSLEVRAGEIIGIAGVAGNGQTELEEVISGLRKSTSGKKFVCGKEITNMPPHAVGIARVAHIPTDRYKTGLISDFKISENSVLQRIDRFPFTKKGTLQWKEIAKEATRLVKQFDVRTPSINTNAGKLSGGNAQKLILARELAREPNVLIAAQPTRGLDISAIEYVHRALLDQRDQGMAILLFSTELTEILTLSDRIAVMYDGRIIELIDRDDADILEIGLLMAGSKKNQKLKQKMVTA
ncbi:MAG: ABC transporter ATP-binding protein [Flexilinea sp.]